MEEHISSYQTGLGVEMLTLQLHFHNIISINFYEAFKVDIFYLAI